MTLRRAVDSIAGEEKGFVNTDHDPVNGKFKEDKEDDFARTIQEEGVPLIH